MKVAVSIPVPVGNDPYDPTDVTNAVDGYVRRGYEVVAVVGAQHTRPALIFMVGEGVPDPTPEPNPDPIG